MSWKKSLLPSIKESKCSFSRGEHGNPGTTKYLTFDLDIIVAQVLLKQCESNVPWAATLAIQFSSEKALGFASLSWKLNISWILNLLFLWGTDNSLFCCMQTLGNTVTYSGPILTWILGNRLLLCGKYNELEAHVPHQLEVVKFFLLLETVHFQKYLNICFLNFQNFVFSIHGRARKLHLFSLTAVIEGSARCLSDLKLFLLQSNLSVLNFHWLQKRRSWMES